MTTLPADPSAENARDDDELLSEFRTHRAESAFRALVRRHLPAVWSAARRMVNGDAALAEDISQEVFVHLAAQAAKLPHRVVLGGWLHRHTCFTAAKALRAASRRRHREHLAADAMHPNPSDSPSIHPLWPDIAPRLDAALNSLSAADRDAVVLRYFEKTDYPAMACALNTSEDAVRMRTNRALEKLRRLLGKRGGVLTAALLITLLRENGVAAPTADAADRISTDALTRAAALPATASAGFGGLTALLTLPRPARPAIFGGAALILALSAAWKLNAAFSKPSLRQGVAAAGNTGSAGSAVPVPQAAAEVTVHYILVPATEALTILNNRWNSDGDTELLDRLLREARPGPGGVRVARILTGTFKSGDHALLGETTEEPENLEFRESGDGASIQPSGKTETVKVGTQALLEVTLSHDGRFCDVNLDSWHHFAPPIPQSWPDGPPRTGHPVINTTEFRKTITQTQVLLTFGSSSMVSCTQLPALNDAVPNNSRAMHLLTFVTAQTAPLP